MGHRLAPVGQVVGRAGRPGRHRGSGPSPRGPRRWRRRSHPGPCCRNRPWIRSSSSSSSVLPQQGRLDPPLHGLVPHDEQEPRAAVVVDPADPQVHVVPRQLGEADPQRQAERALGPALLVGGGHRGEQDAPLVGVHQVEHATTDELVVGEAAHLGDGVRGEPATRLLVHHEREVGAVVGDLHPDRRRQRFGAGEGVVVVHHHEEPSTTRPGDRSGSRK